MRNEYELFQEWIRSQRNRQIFSSTMISCLRPCQPDNRDKDKRRKKNSARNHPHWTDCRSKIVDTDRYYSMFFFVCDILWRCNLKNSWDNWLLKKSSRKVWEMYFMMFNFQDFFTKIWTSWHKKKCWSKTGKKKTLF